MGTDHIILLLFFFQFDSKDGVQDLIIYSGKEVLPRREINGGGKHPSVTGAEPLGLAPLALVHCLLFVRKANSLKQQPSSMYKRFVSFLHFLINNPNNNFHPLSLHLIIFYLSSSYLDIYFYLNFDFLFNNKSNPFIKLHFF